VFNERAKTKRNETNYAIKTQSFWQQNFESSLPIAGRLFQFDYINNNGKQIEIRVFSTRKAKAHEVR